MNNLDITINIDLIGISVYQRLFYDFKCGSFNHIQINT